MPELQAKDHKTKGMTPAEKIERCRGWLPDGKFLSELGSAFTPRVEYILNIRRRERATERSLKAGESATLGVSL